MSEIENEIDAALASELRLKQEQEQERLYRILKGMIDDLVVSRARQDEELRGLRRLTHLVTLIAVVALCIVTAQALWG